jgi:hypothetical protein
MRVAAFTMTLSTLLQPLLTNVSFKRAVLAFCSALLVRFQTLSALCYIAIFLAT